jgi:cobalt-zinc-cadmium efflux system outer membrane protein
MTSRRAIGLLSCLALALGSAGALAATDADHADLPRPEQVEAALRAYPAVRAADADVRGEEANRDRLEAGSHEFALRLTGQQRHDRPLDIRYREYEVGIERGIRLPGKAEKDAELGAVGVELARASRGEALHEGARLLLASWFAWQREEAALRDWNAQVEALQRQLDGLRQRVTHGDAARLEVLLAEAQLAQAEARRAEAAMRRDQAEIDLAQRFPTIERPAQPRLAEPAPVPARAPDGRSWHELILAHSHELAAARSASRRSALAAQRLDAERLPDPTLGLRVASERDGQERIVGLQLSIPLPGAARAASSRAGLAQADATHAREALVLARVQGEARRALAQAQGSYLQWQRLAAVAARVDENTRLLDKAWRLGEGQFAELLTARRQAIEARLAATQAQLDANEARYRLMVDAHQLWEID